MRATAPRQYPQIPTGSRDFWPCLGPARVPDTGEAMTNKQAPRTTVDVVTAQALRLALIGDRSTPNGEGAEHLLRLARGDAITLVRSLHRVQAALADRPSRVGDVARRLLESALARVRSIDEACETG